MAAIMSLMAIATDAMLPALGVIGRDLGAPHENDAQLIISIIFMGMALGQIVLGPLGDSIGRKKSMFIGILIFLVGSIVTLFATSLSDMLIGRFIQGVGLGAPRVVSIAIVRDLFKGREMARVMSNIMSVFILVPMVAPMLGQFVLYFAEWRVIFFVIFTVGCVIGFWFMTRMPETLAAAERTPFSIRPLTKSAVLVCKNPLVMLYTVTSGLVFAGFIAYLSASSRIFQYIYGAHDEFVYIFALIAMAIGIGTHINSRIVVKRSMTSIVFASFAVILCVSVLYLLATWLNGGNLPMWATVGFLVAVVFSNGGLFGNLNAMAMEPMERGAGMAAMLIGVLSTMVSVPLGAFVARFIIDNVYPLAVGMLVFNFAALLLVVYARRFSPEESQSAP